MVIDNNINYLILLMELEIVTPTTDIGAGTFVIRYDRWLIEHET